METAGFESHVEVLAVRVNGEVTVAPFCGDCTVMANAGAMPAASARIEKKEVFIVLPRE
jgi:hypothetical protein